MYDFISKERMDILMAQYYQIMLQSAIGDLIRVKDSYQNFRSMNALFLHEIEKNIEKNVKDKEQANSFIETLECNSTFALFINDCAAANIVTNKLDELVKQYGYLTFDFSDFTETQKSLLLKLDRYEDSESMLNLYNNHLQDLMFLMTSCQPNYDFMRNLQETEKFIEEKTRIEIKIDPKSAQETLELLGIDYNEIAKQLNGNELNSIKLSGVLSPRDPEYDDNQQEIFFYNRMCFIASYRDILKEHLADMDKKYESGDVGTTLDVLQLADKIIAEYEKFVDEPMEVDDYYSQFKQSLKMASGYWRQNFEYSQDEETRGLLQELYVNHCDEYFNIDREIDKVKNGICMA